ncbi:hypothetical protein BH11MYX1_BH11MYX1_01810 [soil metagenome]
MPARHKIAAFVLLSSSAAFAGVPHEPPPPDDQVNPKLLALRDKLFLADPREAMATVMARFRALCDRDGYPLVGNINTKGSQPHQPSEVCTAVREHETKPKA